MFNFMKKNNSHILQINYRVLGTISLDEFRQALWADLAALDTDLRVEFLKAPILRIPITTAHGDPIPLYHLTERPMYRIDTHHYRPACKDYEL